MRNRHLILFLTQKDSHQGSYTEMTNKIQINPVHLISEGPHAQENIYNVYILYMYMYMYIYVIHKENAVMTKAVGAEEKTTGATL